MGTTDLYCTLPARHNVLADNLAVIMRDSFAVYAGYGLIIPKREIGCCFDSTGYTEDPRGGVRWIFPQKAKYWP